MKKRVIFVILLMALLFIIGFALYLYLGKNPSTKSFSSGRVTFEYTQEYSEVAFSPPKQNQAETLIKLQATVPLRVIEFAKEDGAIIGANMTKTNFLDYLERSAEKGLPSVYPDYQKDGSQRVQFSGYDGAIISFHYTGRDLKSRLYTDFFIIPLANDAYYLTIQSTDEKALEAESRVIRDSIRIS